MRLLTYIFLAVITTTLFSCTEEEKVEVEKQLQRKWQYTTDTDEDWFIILKVDQDSKENVYITNIPSLPDSTGNWRLIGDTLLTFYGAPQFEAKKIDSTVITQDSGKAVISYYNNHNKIGEIRENTLQPNRPTSTFKIDKLSDESLVLLSDTGQVIEYTYIPETFESEFSIISVLRGLLGIMTLLTIAWLFSSNRKAIDWALVIKGTLFQIAIALLVLKVPFVTDIFEWISHQFVTVINFTHKGTEFLFANMGSGIIEEPLVTFAIKVLPTVIFFSALTSLFYYWGILQKIVYVFAAIMKRIMNLSGAESMSAAGNIFLGQTESPLLVKPYLMGMTKSEIMCLMTGGMATIAGGVLAAYIGFLGGGDPAQELYFAKHLLTASIMSAPAAIVAAKILVPETENFNKELKVTKDKLGTNELEAIANGTSDGIKLAVNVGGMLLVFTALMAMGNWVLDGIGDITTLNGVIADNTEYSGLSFEMILGYACAPIVWLMGVSADDMIYVGELLGKKTMINEFVAYPRLGEMKQQGLLSEKSIMMATYMLCGFANFASIGIQIGGIGALIPSRKGLLSKLGFRALIGGTIACLMTAVMVGMLM